MVICSDRIEMTPERLARLEQEAWLHIYAQSIWHSEARIKGNRTALERLRQAIDDALATGAGACEAFVSDGEGYHTQISLLSVDALDKERLPYTDEIANPRKNV